MYNSQMGIIKKKKIVFSMGEKWLTKVAQHDLMEKKINGACKA